MLDMANDSNLFRTRDRLDHGNPDKYNADYLPLFEAKMFDPYDHRARTYDGDRPRELTTTEKLDPYLMGTPRYWVSSDEVNRRLLGRWDRQWALCWQDVTDVNTMARTVNFGIIPHAGVGHTAPMFLTQSHPTLVAALKANLTSFVFDYTARQKIGGVHLTYQYLKQLPVLTPDTYLQVSPWDTMSILDFVVPRVLELIYTAHAMVAFARDCGYDGPPFRWNEERRFLLRCELDAAFALLYLPTRTDGKWCVASRVDEGCSSDEYPEQIASISKSFSTPRSALSYILDTFSIVRSKDEKQYGEYRTKRVILEIYDEMRSVATTGEPYRTVLDPSPADPSCCHSPRIAVVDLSALDDGEWARPQGDQTGAETAVLAAVLKGAARPAPIRTVRLAALLAMEPRLLTLSLSSDEASDWRRLVGPEATAPESATVSPRTSANVEWGKAVRRLRGTGLLVEDLAAGTWGPGSGLARIETGGWPDGRVGMVMEVLRRRRAEEVIRTLPANVRDWIDAEAA